MTSLKDFRNLADGMYPVLPSLSIALGDFGYWEKNKWRHLGNIKSDFGRISFTESERTIGHSVKIVRGTEIKSQTGAAVQSGGVNGKLDLVFAQKDSLFYYADLSRELYFPSLEGEIKRFLLDLTEEKQWNADYWIAVSVFCLLTLYLYIPTSLEQAHR